ncbi:galactose oxidase [Dacryopinax primogenitus]|uniref:Galactose oxidase n=1 Tax=Dacryopinax primogenitus (strain DJM 731) TaxID=1858805 RepID=M5G8R7_DACPD|nr:galactose oxidase [Dacryopinax primogenitus]EJU04575.1 galactose oxidase [Dacryopinax primogenitus]
MKPVLGYHEGCLKSHSNRSYHFNLSDTAISFFGGYDSKETVEDVWVLDTEMREWERVEMRGEGPGPLRAHTAVGDERYIFVFGGGSGDESSDELWARDTFEQTWHLFPCSTTSPVPRRAHNSFIYDEHLYVYGGGSGHDALSDLWRIDVSWAALARSKDEPLVWEELQTSGSAPSDMPVPGEEGSPEESKPRAKGCTSATLVGNVLVVLGGQSGRDGDGEGPWGDCWVLNLDDLHWEEKHLNPPIPLASHTATLVGTYLFIFGGNDGSRYCNELNMITKQWETPKIRGHRRRRRGGIRYLIPAW